MNVHVARPAPLRRSRPKKRNWTISDVDRMLDAGIIDRRELIELIGGEIVPMSAKGSAHEFCGKPQIYAAIAVRD